MKLRVYFGSPTLLRHKILDDEYVVIAVPSGKESMVGIGVKKEEMKELLKTMNKILGGE